MNKTKNFVINLDRSPARLKHIKKVFNDQNFNFHRISAVDGKALTASEIAKIYNEKHCLNLIGRRLLPGEIGCALSHLKAWQKLIDLNLEGAFIFEDDILFNEGSKLSDVLYLKNLPCNEANLFLLSPESEKLYKPIKSLSTTKTQVFQSKKTALACGYYINQKAAKNLISYFNLIHHPIDWWAKLRRRRVINTYLVQGATGESIVSPLSEENLPSTIMHNQELSEKKQSFYRKIHSKYYNFTYFKNRDF